MEKVTLIRYKAQCGKLYTSKQGAVRHEENCMCFSNPQFRSCHTCKHNLGLEQGDDYGASRICDKAGQFDDGKFFIPNTAFGDCINCPMWESDTYKGPFKKWVGYAKQQPAQTEIINDNLPF